MTKPCLGHAAESAWAEHMKEAERLLGEYADARVDFLSNGTPGDIEARAALLAHIQRGAPAPAEVPMPQGYVERPSDYTGDIWIESQMRTYGDAREAAGYARGLRDAVRDADIEALRLYVRALCKAVDAATDFAGTVAGGASWWDDVWADHAAALDRARERISQAALRGEVKP